MADEYDWIGRRLKLQEVVNETAYYVLFKGSSSRVFHIYIPDMEKNIGSKYFLTKEDLVQHVLNKHERAIAFIKEQTAKKDQ